MNSKTTWNGISVRWCSAPVSGRVIGACADAVAPPGYPGVRSGVFRAPQNTDDALALASGADPNAPGCWALGSIQAGGSGAVSRVLQVLNTTPELTDGSNVPSDAALSALYAAVRPGAPLPGTTTQGSARATMGTTAGPVRTGPPSAAPRSGTASSAPSPQRSRSPGPTP